MKTILYVHGFASSGNSGTPQMLRQMLYQSGVRVLSPDVPTSPLEAMALLRTICDNEQPDLIVGTSMGACYAEQLRGFCRILVNPSFQMARLLTFRGMGKHAFLNKREDGAREFKVDKTMIAEFREVEKHSFQTITPAEKSLVWGLFGEQDESVNHQKDFLRHYDRAHFRTFEGGHRLNDRVLNAVVIPLVRELLDLG